jgi:Domain of unknown function (DUF932)
MNTRHALSNEEIQRFAPSAFAGQPYHAMSGRYAFVPTSQVIDGMRSAGFMPVMASQSSSRIAGKENFTKHMLRFRSVNSQLTNVGDSDLETVLINSHDGTSRYVLMLGVFRLVCSNGLIVSESLVAGVKVRHIGDIVQSVIDGSLDLIDQAPKIQATINQWRTITLTQDEQGVFAKSAHLLRFPEQESTLAQAIKPETLLKARRYDDNGSDLWSTFNRVQENAINGGMRGLVRNGYRLQRRTARSVTGIDQNVNLNKKLWQLAEETAQVKQSN